MAKYFHFAYIATKLDCEYNERNMDLTAQWAKSGNLEEIVICVQDRAVSCYFHSNHEFPTSMLVTNESFLICRPSTEPHRN